MTRTKKGTGRIRIMLIFAITALWCLASAAYAQTPAASRPGTTARPSPKEKRIIILGTTIVGSIAKPGVVYEVPWKGPESLKKGLDEPQRSFQGEIFSPLDKEQFESQMK